MFKNNSKELTTIFGMLFFVAFDHKGEDGGGIFTYISIGGFFAIYFFDLIRNKKLFSANIFGILIILPVIYSLINIQKSNFYFINYIKASIPFLMCYCFVDLVSRLNFGDLLRALDAIYFAAVVSILFTFFYGYYEYGGDLSSIRFQIVSPMICVAAPVASVRIIFGNGLRIFDSIVLLCVIQIVLISVTRGIMLSLVGCIMFILFFGVVSLKNNKNKKKRLSLIFIALFIFGAFGLYSQPELVDRWIFRTGASDDYGFDPTSLTRLAEVEYQINYLKSDLLTLFTGAGIGSEYEWAGTYDGYISMFLSESDLYGKFSYVGHNFWVYSIYSGGIVFGLMTPLLIIFVAAGYINYLFSANKFINNDATSFCFCGAGFFVFIVISTIGGNPFVTRLGAISVGFFVGAFACLCLLKENQK